MQLNADTGMWFLRVSMGAMMALHGLAKIVGGGDTLRYVAGMVPQMPDDPTLRLVMGGLAAAMELVGGIGLIIGCHVRWAAGMLIVVLAAALCAHLGAVKDFPSLMLNTWPLELIFVMVALFFVGGCSKQAPKNDAK
jgi:putative oxidoreductase